MSAYDLTTLVQVFIAMAAFFAAVQMHTGASVMPLMIGRPIFFVGIGVDQIWWSFAREAFAGKAWITEFFWFVQRGIDAKVWFEATNFALWVKAAIFTGLALVIYARTTEAYSRRER